MKVIDLRPVAEKLFGAARQTSTRRLWHQPAGCLADALTRRRVARRLAPPTDLLTISVGNLRVGGTGKTPVVMQLALDLAARGVVGGVITRGYRAPDPAPRLVHIDDHEAGDEARLLADRLEPVGWGVVQARDRLQGLEQLRRAIPRAQVVILEDAHQTARVGRHTDIVILDDWRLEDGRMLPVTGATLPFGPYRETERGAERAEIWLVEDVVPEGCVSAAGVPVMGFRRQAPVPPETLPGDGPVGLVCGLARPDGFEATATEMLARPPALSVRLGDHAHYSLGVLARLERLTQDHGLRAWLTTAKDQVKLGPLWTSTTPLVVVGLDVAWTTTPTLPDLIEERLTKFQRVSG